MKSIPYQPSIFGFFYNKTLFEKAGIKAVPTTWAEFDAVCQKLVDAGITPITGDTTYQTSTLGYHLGRYLGQDGVKALVNDPACEDAGAVNWDDERVLKALKDYEDFAKKGYFSEQDGIQRISRRTKQRVRTGRKQQLLSVVLGYQTRLKVWWQKT